MLSNWIGKTPQEFYPLNNFMLLMSCEYQMTPIGKWELSFLFDANWLSIGVDLRSWCSKVEAFMMNPFSDLCCLSPSPICSPGRAEYISPYLMMVRVNVQLFIDRKKTNPRLLLPQVYQGLCQGFGQCNLCGHHIIGPLCSISGCCINRPEYMFPPWSISLLNCCKRPYVRATGSRGGQLCAIENNSLQVCSWSFHYSSLLKGVLISGQLADLHWLLQCDSQIGTQKFDLSKQEKHSRN